MASDAQGLAIGSSEDERMHESAQELAAVTKFEADNLLIMCVLLVSALLLGRVLHRHHVSSLTESGLFIAVGVLFGGLMYILVENGAASREAMQHFFFNHELFNLILLPHIIFEAGFSLPRDLFFTRIGAILAFAVGGTAIATLFTWLLIVACAQAGLILKLSTIEAGALAALISAIDPVSTLTLFKLLRVHPDLHNILFGESVLNDAVSIILFRSIQRFFVADFRPLTDTLLSLVAFGEVASGSIGIGLLVAFGAAGVLKLSRLGHTADSAIVESGVFWIFSYGSFLVAEAAGLSGIVSALFCGIAMQRYAAPNLSAEARVAVPLLLQTIASLAEATVFVLVGLATWVYVDQSNVWTLTLVTMVGCFGGRALNIFGISRFLNHRAKPEYRIPLNHQLVMWFSGLRGAIAVTLAVQVPGSHHDEIVMCTVVIVLFTTFVLGGLSEPLIARARIERGPEVIAAFHAERKRRKREAREAFEDGTDFLIYAHRASEMSAHAHDATHVRGLSRLRARARHTLNLCRDPRASMSVFAAIAYLDKHYLRPLLVDGSVDEAVAAARAGAAHAAGEGAGASRAESFARQRRAAQVGAGAGVGGFGGGGLGGGGLGDDGDGGGFGDVEKAEEDKVAGTSFQVSSQPLGAEMPLSAKGPRAVGGLVAAGSCRAGGDASGGVGPRGGAGAGGDILQHVDLGPAVAPAGAGGWDTSFAAEPAPRAKLAGSSGARSAAGRRARGAPGAYVGDDSGGYGGGFGARGVGNGSNGHLRPVAEDADADSSDDDDDDEQAGRGAGAGGLGILASYAQQRSSRLAAEGDDEQEGEDEEDEEARGARRADRRGGGGGEDGGGAELGGAAGVGGAHARWEGGALRAEGGTAGEAGHGASGVPGLGANASEMHQSLLAGDSAPASHPPPAPA